MFPYTFAPDGEHCTLDYFRAPEKVSKAELWAFLLKLAEIFGKDQDQGLQGQYKRFFEGYFISIDPCGCARVHLEHDSKMIVRITGACIKVFAEGILNLRADELQEPS